MKVLIAAGLALLSSQANALDRFNLDCARVSGTDQRGLHAPDVHLRIDIPSAQYCADDCASVQHIHDVLADRIVLAFAPFTDRSIAGSRTNYLDRVTGQYHEATTLTFPTQVTLSTDWACQVRPFSGFPATRF